MALDLGVLVVHGMGSQGTDFAESMIADLSNRISGLGQKPERICWERGYWADVLASDENDLWQKVSQNSQLDYSGIRKFVISAFGDAIAYQREPAAKIDKYSEIHNRIHDHLVHLRQQLGNVDKPIIVIAHSLGCDIMSNYIWDAQHWSKGQPDPYQGANIGNWSGVEKLETLCGFITFGCNIALFTLALDEVRSIQFPGRSIADKLRPAAKWLNYFDPDDVLGYPMKPLSDSYDQAVTADLEINVGSILTSWNPLCHADCWTDGNFTQPVAKQIADVLSVFP